MKSHDNNITEIFGASPGDLFSVPNYQRYYVWEKNDILAFLNDAFYCYERNQAGENYDHFFGQMVFRFIEKDRSSRSLFEIVDGQQRLTTFELTVAAIYRIILSRTAKFAEPQKKEVDGILKEIDNDYISSIPHSGEKRRRLTLSKRDDPLLRTILIDTLSAEEVKKIPDIKELNHESEKRILNAYSILHDRINKQFASEPDDTVSKKLKNFLDTIAKNFSVVKIESTSPGYSYALFQIVNDRGVLLTSAELLKARTMELLSPNTELFNACEAVWNDILDDSGKETKNYLSWYYAARVLKSPPSERMHEAYERDIFDVIGKRQLNEEQQNNLSQKVLSLHEGIKRCRTLAKGKIPFDGISPQIESLFYALVVGLKNEASIPVYLKVLEMQDDAKIIDLVNRLTVLLSKFFFVAKTVSNIHAGSIQQVYRAIGRKIEEGNLSISVFESECRKKLEEKKCKDSFDRFIASEIYHPQSTNVCKFLLFYLELFYLTTARYSAEDILSRDEATIIVYDKLSTEHVAAREGADTDGINISAADRNRLGNLTLLGTRNNSDLGSKPFSYKKTIYTQSPFAITRELCELTDWDAEAFTSRQNKLESKAKEIFTI